MDTQPLLTNLYELQKQLESYKMRCEVLEQENYELKEKFRDIFAASSNNLKIIFNLTPHEAIILGYMFNKFEATRENLMNALYFNSTKDINIKIIDVFVCKLRKKLKKFNIKIDTIWGKGYLINKENKEKLTEIINEKMKELS